VVAGPATLALIRRYPLQRGRIAGNLAWLLVGNTAVYLAITNVRFLLRVLSNAWSAQHLGPPLDWRVYVETQSVLIPLDFLAYFGFFATSFAIDSYYKYRQRAEEVLRLRLEATQLQSDLAHAQLAALRGQLHPHFLFNTFNAISTLVRQRKNEFAVEMITQVSDLLRQTMENIELQELTLEREVDFIRCYLDLERVRFGRKLRSELLVEPEAMFGLVPNFLLQPLVENAVKHGISQRTTPGCVRLEASRREGRLHLEITDDGPGIGHAPKAPRPGIGLRNTRRRLDHLYQGDYRLDITERPEGGTSVRLDLPWRENATAKARSALTSEAAA
jgi:signal transduction histidine kinase